MSNTTEAAYDFWVADHGSIFILTPTSPECIEHLQEHIQEDAQRWGPNGYVVEHRYIQDLVDALQGEGFAGRSL